MENKVEDRAAEELSKENFSNSQKLESDKLEVFQNFLTVEDWSEIENSTNHDQTIREALKRYIKKRKVRFHLHPRNDPIYDKCANDVDTLLHAAFKAGYYDVVHLALTNYRGFFNSTSKNNMIHFHIACVTNNSEAAENFLEGYINPNEPLSLDSDKYSGLRPVELAIEKNYFQLFVILVRYSVDLSIKNSSGLSPLQMIYHSNLPNTGKSWIEEAFKHGNDTKYVNSKDEYGVSHFHLCCMLNEPDFIKVFIQNGVDVNDSISEECPMNPGFSPLHFAAVNCAIDVVILLLQNGADPNKSDASGRTPLHYVCEMPEGDQFSDAMPLNLVIKLMRFNANPFAVDKKGFTPIHLSFYAAKVGTWDAPDLLMEQLNTKVNYTDEHGLSLFHMACTQFCVGPVINFLNSGVDVNKPVSSGIYRSLTALHFAAMHYNKGVIEVLLERGASINVKDDEMYFTPLHYACEQYDPSDESNGVQSMLKWKASPVTVDRKGRTPLHVVFYRSIDEDFDMVDKLLPYIEWGADNYTDDQGVSMFHIACTTSDVNQVVKFLNSGVNIDNGLFLECLSGFTPLHLAVMYNRKEVVKLLLERNAKVNARSGECGITPLHLACEFRYRRINRKKMPEEVRCTNPEEIIKLLLLHGADVNAKDSFGNTPLLHLCAIDKYYNRTNVTDIWFKNSHSRDRFYNDLSNKLEVIIEILISNKSDIKARNTDKWTIMHILSRYTLLNISEKLMELLLKSGVDLNEVDSAGLTPLHIAVKNTDIDIVRTLLKFGADPNIKCNNSRIPLHISVEQIIILSTWEFMYDLKMKDIFFLLVENNSDVNVINESDGILLHKAIRNCNHFLTENLLKYGADLNTEDASGNSSVSSLLEQVLPNKIWWSTIKVVLLHIRWLEAIKLPISQKVKNCYFSLYSHYISGKSQESSTDISPNEMYMACCAESDIMKNIKIDKYTSLYDVLRKCPHDLMNHVENKNLIEIVNDANLIKKFIMYGHRLRLQFKKGMIRKHVTQSADIALCNILNKNLPNPCRDAVLKYLTNEEVVILLATAPVDRDDESCKKL